MREKVVRSYQRREPPPPAQLVTVVEDIGATIEAWHGGCLLKEFSTYTNVKSAIQEACDDAESYSVDASSSLRLRVRETVSHSHVEGGQEDDRYRNGKILISSYKVLERHVLDVVSGPIEHEVVQLEWRSGAVIAFPQAAWNPGADVTSFLTPYALRGFGSRFLYDGFGYANFEFTDVSQAPYEKGSCIYKPSEKEIERAPKAIRLNFRGKQDVLVPKGTTPQQAIQKLADEGLDICCSFDWTRSNGIARHWHIFVGEPVTKLAFSPAA